MEKKRIFWMGPYNKISDPQATLRILMLGSSHVESMNRCLQELLNKKGKSTNMTEIIFPHSGAWEVYEYVSDHLQRGQYDIIYLVCGDNDLYHNGGIRKHTVKETVLKMQDMLTLLHNLDYNPVLTPLFPRGPSKLDPAEKGPALPFDVYREYNTAVQYYNRKLPVSFYITEFWSGRKIDVEYYMPDGVNLNFKGKQVLAEYWEKFL